MSVGEEFFPLHELLEELRLEVEARLARSPLALALYAQTSKDNNLRHAHALRHPLALVRLAAEQGYGSLLRYLFAQYAKEEEQRAHWILTQALPNALRHRQVQLVDELLAEPKVLKALQVRGLSAYHHDELRRALGASGQPSLFPALSALLIEPEVNLSAGARAQRAVHHERLLTGALEANQVAYASTLLSDPPLDPNPIMAAYHAAVRAPGPEALRLVIDRWDPRLSLLPNISLSYAFSSSSNLLPVLAERQALHLVPFEATSAVLNCDKREILEQFRTYRPRALDVDALLNEAARIPTPSLPAIEWLVALRRERFSSESVWRPSNSSTVNNAEVWLPYLCACPRTETEALYRQVSSDLHVAVRTRLAALLVGRGRLEASKHLPALLFQEKYATVSRILRTEHRAITREEFAAVVEFSDALFQSSQVFSFSGPVLPQGCCVAWAAEQGYLIPFDLFTRYLACTHQPSQLLQLRLYFDRAEVAEEIIFNCADPRRCRLVIEAGYPRGNEASTIRRLALAGAEKEVTELLALGYQAGPDLVDVVLQQRYYYWAWKLVQALMPVDINRLWVRFKEEEEEWTRGKDEHGGDPDLFNIIRQLVEFYQARFLLVPDENLAVYLDDLPDAVDRLLQTEDRFLPLLFKGWRWPDLKPTLLEALAKKASTEKEKARVKEMERAIEETERNKRRAEEREKEKKAKRLEKKSQEEKEKQRHAFKSRANGVSPLVSFSASSLSSAFSFSSTPSEFVPPPQAQSPSPAVSSPPPPGQPTPALFPQLPAPEPSKPPSSNPAPIFSFSIPPPTPSSDSAVPPASAPAFPPVSSSSSSHSSFSFTASSSPSTSVHSFSFASAPAFSLPTGFSFSSLAASSSSSSSTSFGWGK